MLSKIAYSLSLVALLGGLVACGGGTTDTAADSGDAAPAEEASGLTGTITIDGSSTVFPISEAMAEEFQIANPDVKITVGASGTGGGFEKFCAGETQVSNASRGVKPEEIAKCAEAGIEMIEVPVATDALTVVVNPDNDWATCMTIDELSTIWSPEAEGTIDNWNQVNPAYPDAPLVLYGPGTDSGTFDYFTDEVNGEEGASRGDYTASEDDNVLVQGVEGDTNALGYFGYAYFFENQDRMKAVEIDGGSGCVAPDEETVLAGEYTPFSRPLFIYVSKAAYEEDEAVKAFVNFYLDPTNKDYVGDTGYVALSDEQYAESLAKVEGGEVKTAE
ncbi:MAG: PstS family phosphate ABC transporter substrate-binding protein [Cyanobacteria bacterium]|nr:PstS family phosphate ABC transporter substrate-binding protein [Cyanobacteriota bacterium]